MQKYAIIDQDDLTQEILNASVSKNSYNLRTSKLDLMAKKYVILEFEDEHKIPTDVFLSRVSILTGDALRTILQDDINGIWEEVLENNFEDLKCVNFDGVNDHILCGDAGQYDVDTTYSISTWINPETIAPNQCIYSKVTLDANIYGYSIFLEAANGKAKIFIKTTGASFFHTFSDVAFTTGSWQHLVVTYDGSSNAGGFSVYRNAVKGEAFPSNTLFTGDMTTQPFVFGMRHSLYYYKGKINEATIWNKELTQSEVTEIYNAGTTADPLMHSALFNLKNHYTMGDGDTYPTIQDNKGTDDGTMTNMGSEDIEDV